ncbi:MAG: hypothetical protein E6H66_08315 [Betaproteobacteria bacterium]|nr:MAG: hypothetical protein E6H66_08315 [Betaproteobacteria bacterium]
MRLERGTHMYLTLYHQRSTALMREMQGEEGGTDEQLLRQEHALELENAALKTIARKLSPGFCTLVKERGGIHDV